MNNVLLHKKEVLTFRQWSRKSYAIFSSLRKEVNIGHINIDICDKAIEKNSNKYYFVLNSNLNLEEDIEELEESSAENIDLQKGILLSITSNLSDSSQRCCNLTKTYINKIVCPEIQDRPFLLNKFKMNNQNSIKIIKSNFVFKRWNRKGYSVFNSLSKIVKITALCVAYSILILPKQLLAQTDTTVTKILNLDEIVVSAQKAPVVYSQLSRMVSTISREEIKLMPVSSVNDLLENVAGLDVRQRGANGMQADVSIRGGSFDQNLILLNGVNISDPQTGHHGMNLPIDLNSIEKIEILEGPGSRVFGPNAFSGAINIVTNTYDESFIKAKVTAGDFGLFSGNITNNTSFKNWNHFISISKSQSKGYVSNTDYDQFNAFYNIRYNSDFGSIDFQIGYTDKSFGANSFYTPKYPNQYEQTKTTFTSLKFETGEKIKLIPTVYFRRHQDRFELFREDYYSKKGNYYVRNETDTAKFYPDIYATWNYYGGHNYHLTDVYGAKIESRIKTKIGTTSFGAELRSENVWSNVLGNNMDEPIDAIGESEGEYTKNYSRTISNYFIEQTYHAGNLSLSGGLLASWVSENHFDFNFYPGAEISYRFLNYYSTYLSVNKSLRLPTFTDLFYSGPDNIGNPDLKPEQALSYEYGIKVNSEKIKSNVSFFYRDAKDVIAWVRDTAANDNEKWATQNLTNVNTLGLSFNGSFKVNKFSINYININYAFLDQSATSKDTLNTKYSLNYLKHNFNLSVNHKIVDNLSFTWNVRYQNRTGVYPRFVGFDLDPIDTNFDPFILVDIKLNWDYKIFNFYAEVSNLFNQDYIDIGNIEMPGRWFKAGLQVRIGY